MKPSKRLSNPILTGYQEWPAKLPGTHIGVVTSKARYQLIVFPPTQSVVAWTCMAEPSATVVRKGFARLIYQTVPWHKS